MEQGIINNIVTTQALKQVDNLTVKLTAALTVMEKLIAAQSGGGKINTKGQKELADALQRLTKLEEQLAAAKKKTIGLTEEERQVNARSNKEKRLTAQLNIAAEGSYAKLSAQYRLGLFQLQNYSKEELNAIGGKRKLIAEILRLNIALKQQDLRVGNAQRNVGNYASAFGMLGNAAAVAGTRVLMFGRQLLMAFGLYSGILLLVKGIRDTFKTIEDFGQAMANIKAVANATDEQMVKFKDTAITLGVKTKFTSAEVAGLELELVKLGFTAGQVIAATAGITLAAAATGEGLVETAKIVGATTMAFGMSASETGRVADVMAKAFSRSALKLDSFADSMKYVAPVSKQAGISIEETTALLGVLANNGIKGSMAGTSLRNIMLELIGTGGNLQEKIQALAKAGLNMADANTEVGKRAMVSLLILKDNLKVIPQLTKEFENSYGYAQQASDKRLDTITGRFTLLKSTWAAFIISMDDGEGKFSQILKKMADRLNETIQGLKYNLMSAKEQAMETAKDVATGLMDKFVSKNRAKPDYDKQIDDRIATDRKLYKADQDKILQNNILIRQDLAKGKNATEIIKLREENKELAKNVRIRVEFVNQLTAEKQARKETLKMTEDTAAVAAANQGTDEATKKEKAEALKEEEKSIQNVINRSTDYVKVLGAVRPANEDAAQSFANLQKSIASLEKEKELLSAKTVEDKIKIEQDYARQIRTIDLELAKNRLEIQTEGDEDIKKRYEQSVKIILGIVKDQSDAQKTEYEKSVETKKDIKDKESDIEKTGFDIAKSLGDSYFEVYSNKLQDESEAYKSMTDSKLADLEQANKEGLISDEDYQTEKLQIEADATAHQNELDKKERQAKKEAFLLQQAIAIAELWFDYAKATGASGFNPLLQPWYLGEAIAMTALIAAQSIPYFEHGGTTDRDGNIIVNEKRRELVVEPSGRAYIPQTDGATMLNVPKGTTIFPDASTITNDTITRMVMLNTGSTTDVSGLRKDLHVLTEEVKKLKTESAKPLSLMDELNIAKRLKLN